MDIKEQYTLEGLVDKIFDKALTDTHFLELYSDMCFAISLHPDTPKVRTQWQQWPRALRLLLAPPPLFQHLHPCVCSSLQRKMGASQRTSAACCSTSARSSSRRGHGCVSLRSLQQWDKSFLSRRGSDEVKREKWAS